MPIAKLNQDDIANLSRSLVVSNTTLLQQRLMMSAVSAFVPSDKCLMSSLESEVNSIAKDLIVIKNSEAADLTEHQRKLASNAKIINNVSFYSVGEMEHIKWTPAALIECARIFFHRHDEHLDFRFDLDSFMEFWVPELHKTKRAPNQAVKGIVQSLDAITKTSYRVQYKDGGRLRYESVPIFSGVSVADFRYIDVSLNARFMAYLIFFRKEIRDIGYTKFPLYLIKGATSEYTMRLWMILLRRATPFLKNTEVRIPIEELRNELGVDDAYKSFSDLRKYTLDKAIADIIDITASIEAACEEDLIDRERVKLIPFDDGKCYKAEMRGRKTVSVVFKIDTSKMAFASDNKTKTSRTKPSSKNRAAANSDYDIRKNSDGTPNLMARILNEQQNSGSGEGKIEVKSDKLDNHQENPPIPHQPILEQRLSKSVEQEVQSDMPKSAMDEIF